MNLRDALDAVEPPNARRERGSHPKGFEPGVKFDGDGPSEATIVVREVPGDEAAWRAKITEVTTLPVPDDRRVELREVRYWGDPSAPNIYCKFAFVEHRLDDSLDAVKVLNGLRRGARRPRLTAFTGSTTLATSWNDWQVAKREGGGTEALAGRLDAAFDGTAERARELRKIGRDLGHLLILGGGDIVEGCNIFPNQPFEIDGDRRTQVNNAVTFIMDGLDRLAPMFERVTVLAVGGNHGQNRQNGRAVNRHDNDDAAVFEHAARAADRDSRLQHVDFVIAQSEPAKTLDVHGWVVGTTHGDVFQRNGGGGVEQKAYRWYSGQAAGHMPIGDCSLLVTHHWHHYQVRDWGACMWVQTPTMDGGSPHFTDSSGLGAEPGMLTWVMSPEKRFADAQIL